MCFGSAANIRNLPRSAAKLYAFVDMIEALRTSELPLDVLYDQLLDKSRYIAMLQEKDTPGKRVPHREYSELKSNILGYMKENGEQASLAGFLDEIALYTDTDQLDGDADCAVLMTIHSAKGLEFPTVFLVVRRRGIFPGARSIGEPEEIEEERRPVLRGHDACEEKVIHNRSQAAHAVWQDAANRISRFVEEIPEENLEKTADAAPRYASGGAGAGAFPGRRNHPPRPAAKRTLSFGTPNGQAGKASVTFEKGERVAHKSFGEGTVLNVSPMGGDALLEMLLTRSEPSG